ERRSEAARRTATKADRLGKGLVPDMEGGDESVRQVFRNSQPRGLRKASRWSVMASALEPLGDLGHHGEGFAQAVVQFLVTAKGDEFERVGGVLFAMGIHSRALCWP
ncbi:MAG: hypothetical protein HN849_05680, partial [Victivallales bacterium]|nr:hypothetical protein [Victivallales bacterium]